MKSIFTLLALVISTMTCLSQTPITINATDVPIPFQTFNFDDITAKKPVSPDMGTDKNWDYGTYFGDDQFTVTYFEEVDTFFTKFGIDNYTLGFKSLTSQLGYYVENELDFNDKGVDDVGAYIGEQVYSLQSFTGNATDNITFPLQAYAGSAPRKIMQFPLKINTGWSSVTKRSNKFTIKVAAFGLNNVPSSHTYSIIRKDSIVGWGKLRVYTPQGPSKAYDVLVDKVFQYSVDSFYVGGKPAPPALTTAFGIKQGQITDVLRQYNFLRSGTFAYLMRINYGTDTTYTKVQSAFVHKDDLELGTSATDFVSGRPYSTVLFPNPVSGNSIQLLITASELGNVHYELSDLQGKLVQSQKNISLNNNMLQIDLDTHLASGTYILRVTDLANRQVATEKVHVIR
jgi:hypothetical protein